MDELRRQLLIRALNGQGLPFAQMGLREGEWNTANQRLHPIDPMNSLGAIPIPEAHQGNMFNLGGRGWADGSAQSLDFYLQPRLQPGNVGVNGAGLLFRKTW